MTQLLVHPVRMTPAHHQQRYLYQSNNQIIGMASMTPPPMKKVIFPSTIHKNESTELPEEFVPGRFDIICSHGKTAKHHAGNVYFGSIIDMWTKQYQNTIEKRAKSKIVQQIIETIQTKSPQGGFVKKVSDGRWCVVSAEQAREKVSQSLRDKLAGHYRSSQGAKKRSRKESNLKRLIDFEEIVEENRFISASMAQLSETVSNANNSDSLRTRISDEALLCLMTETNTGILQQLKQDQTIQQTFRFEELQRKMPKRNELKTLIRRTVDETLKQFDFDKDFILLQQPISKRRKKF